MALEAGPAGAAEIEITPEMATAGFFAIDELISFADQESIARAVYTAMERQRLKDSTVPALPRD